MEYVGKPIDVYTTELDTAQSSCFSRYVPPSVICTKPGGHRDLKPANILVTGEGGRNYWTSCPDAT
jgi:hypothetical protein